MAHKLDLEPISEDEETKQITSKPTNYDSSFLQWDHLITNDYDILRKRRRSESPDLRYDYEFNDNSPADDYDTTRKRRRSESPDLQYDYEIICIGELNPKYKKDVLEIVEQNKVAVSSNTWIVENLANNSFFFWNLWHQNKADSKIIDNKCPHKGVELVNKCGTCPAHGLQWDFQTGRLAEYKLPFYLEITNYEIPDPTNNRGIIENNTCKVVIQNKYPLTKNIKAIMVDSLGKRYGKMYHKLNNAIKFYNPGDIINFDTSQICV